MQINSFRQLNTSASLIGAMLIFGLTAVGCSGGMSDSPPPKGTSYVSGAADKIGAMRAGRRLPHKGQGQDQ